MKFVIHLLIVYKYILLFPLAIIEGPILAVIAGFLCTNHFLNPFYVYPIIVLGDITGDSLCYSLGRFGVPSPLKKIIKFFGFKLENIQKVRSYFDANPIKTISLSKLALGIGVTGIYLAGNIKIPYKKFIVVCFFTSMIQYVFYFGLGLLFGSAYQQINHYLNLFSAFTIVVTIAILLVVFIKLKLKK